MLLLLPCLAMSAYAQIPGPQAEAPGGATLFKRQCGACHSLVSGETRQGPSLAGVYGRKAGSVAGFNYSPGFKTADFDWDEAHLDPYLTNPRSVIPGGVMAYRQAKPEIRHMIIEYLKEQR